MNRKKVAITLGIMCFILTIAICVQYKTIKNASTLVGTSNANTELKSEVLYWKEKYDEEYKKMESTEKILEAEREKFSKKDKSSIEAENELKKANAISGSTEVTGKGIIVTLTDNRNVTSENISTLDSISNYLIHDSDLLRLVNELKNAGAEAISINDERITNLTSITCDGNVILVNGNKISSPFIIMAIGSQESLLGAIQRPGGLIDSELQNYGLVSSIKKNNKIVIPKFNGVLDYKYIKK